MRSERAVGAVQLPLVAGDESADGSVVSRGNVARLDGIELDVERPDAGRAPATDDCDSHVAVSETQVQLPKTGGHQHPS